MTMAPILRGISTGAAWCLLAGATPTHGLREKLECFLENF
jgi:hypothetical protein